MRSSSKRARAALLTTLLFPALSTAIGTIDCGRIRTDGVTFDLGRLSGPHSVMHSVEQPPSWKNTTYTIDICRPLERPKSVKDDKSFCPGGTRVCAVEHIINGDQDTVSEVIPIAGDLKNHAMGDLDAQFERIKSSASHSDTDKEGVRIIMNGGEYNKRKQRAIVEFICNKDLIGDEGTRAGQGKPAVRRTEEEDDNQGDGKKEDGDKGDENSDDTFTSALTFTSYGPDADDKIDILRLQWQTKFACEDAEQVPKGWGFFTWFIILAFLGTAAYLVFGSWLNYNRYGARGWDLLPHGDTIRDVPYLLRDWSRRVINTVQGSGSRGGYSAV